MNKGIYSCAIFKWFILILIILSIIKTCFASNDTIAVKGKINMDTEFKDITAEEAMLLIQNDTPLILDVRTKQEFDERHIKNSVLIPIDELANRLTEIEDYKNKKVFVYCRSGRRSRIALELMKKNGFKFIYNLKYGIIKSHPLSVVSHQ